MNEDETRVTGYRMNPAEDEILFGGELAEGMWVLPESDSASRLPYGAVTEDEKIRAQRFRQVTRLTQAGGLTQFIGVWVDGYAMVHSYGADLAWLVKKDPPGQAAAEGERP